MFDFWIQHDDSVASLPSHDGLTRSPSLLTPFLCQV
jgi:hypothetical protein